MAELTDTLTFLAHFPVLVHHAMDTALTHGFIVMNMLRCKAAIFLQNNLYA